VVLPLAARALDASTPSASFGQARHWLNDYCFILYSSPTGRCFWVAWRCSICMYRGFPLRSFAFSGLMHFGTVVFRWAAVVSVIVSLSSISYGNRGILILPDIALGLMRSVGILELCLLAFLCLSMNALRLSVRDMAFGISLGFGLMSSNDFVMGTMLSHHSSLIEPLQFMYQSLVLVSIGIWVTYGALPEFSRQAVLLPRTRRSTAGTRLPRRSDTRERRLPCSAARRQLLPYRRGEGGGESAD